MEDTDENDVLDMMQEANADLLFVGHSHKPYHRILKTTDGRFKHIINLGSVGKPKDKDQRACYVLLTIHANSSVWEKDSIHVEFRRIEYDVETAAKAIESSPLPNEFAKALRLAK
ncbi:hypothetical protein ADIARSV_3447 [Arcticibacter svalbardensis MN12-7]|uniref:Calcineurin-like phosphoesterase domain-containing protein n=1 Tax=Arcticibacter svalbardensis MN12-7 TaxID=1150600 RepID=R9GNR3_9SPHI|nr:hypothetical protein ADIARSV_3447 [Arcticibacter svalbardensis MN12-7]